MQRVATCNFSELVGIPFEYGARGPDAFDCYGLLKYLYRECNGVEIESQKTPESDSERAAAVAVGSISWKPCGKRRGVAVLFRILGVPTHVGYVIDDEHFIHTWERSGGVLIERISEWEHRIIGYYDHD